MANHLSERAEKLLPTLVAGHEIQRSSASALGRHRRGAGSVHTTLLGLASAAFQSCRAENGNISYLVILAWH